MSVPSVEAAAAAFALAVMAWVIYRLTWTIVRLVTPKREREESEDEASEG